MATKTDEVTALPEVEAETELREWAVFTATPYGERQAFIIQADRFRQDGTKCLFEDDAARSGFRIVAVFPLTGFLGAYVIGQGVRVAEERPPLNQFGAESGRHITEEELEAIRRDQAVAAELYDPDHVQPTGAEDTALD